MNKRKKRKNFISILLIPDDHSDPFNFKISIKVIKLLSIIATLLIIHVFAGFVFYYKYSVTNRYRNQLERENINLKEDNRQISSLYDKVEELVQYNNRLRAVLEVDQGFTPSDRKASQILNKIRRNQNINLMVDRGGKTSAYQNMPVTKGNLDFFLTREKNKYHQFANNIPTYLPVEGYLTTDFRKGDWFLPNHLGIDIAASRGSAVHAAADGVVIFANWTEDLGNLIILYHFNGFLTFYGHNQILLRKENSIVKKGDKIALLGNSGQSTAPHLHFEVWKDGKPVNPKKYLLKFQKNSKDSS